MLIKTTEGVVVGKEGQQLTLLLESGAKKQYKEKDITLQTGDECVITINHETGEVSKAVPIGMALADALLEEPPEPVTHPELEDYPDYVDWGSVLGDSGLMEYLE